jgi:hypothetical protein
MSEKEEASLEASQESMESGGSPSESLKHPSDSLAPPLSPTAAPRDDGLDPIIKRRSRLQSSWAALRYIQGISRDNYVRLRVSDRLTSVALLLAAILAILSLVFHPLEHIRLPLAFLCDGLVGAMLVLYLLNRFGILIVLSPRQALLTWQMIVVSCVVGIFLTVNVGVFIAILVLNPTLLTSF